MRSSGFENSARHEDFRLTQRMTASTFSCLNEHDGQDASRSLPSSMPASATGPLADYLQPRLHLVFLEVPPTLARDVLYQLCPLEQHSRRSLGASAAAAVCVAPAPIYPSLQPFSRGLCPIARRSPHLYLMQGTDTLVCPQAISSRSRDERAKIAGWMLTATILRNRPFLASHIADSDPEPIVRAPPIILQG
ncbi:hypothetical protein Landi51_08158 [Colletotrichum acutatum]